MKALFRYMTLALTTMLVFGACTKTSIPDGISGSQSSPVEVQKIFVSGNDVDLTLNAFSSSGQVTRFDLYVDRRLIESFRLPQNDDLTWHLENLSIDSHRINIYVGFASIETPSYSSFQFTISDGTSIQTVSLTKIDQRNYGFDLVIEK
jgi:hypothetical protein